MQGSAAPRLSANDLACRRGERLLFRALSLDLSGGEALHVTGANGTGKTTLIRALSGLTTPFAGRVAHEGAIGLLDERPALDPDLALGKALRFWERIDDCGDPGGAMSVLGLEPLLDVPVRYLSTGQRKRAGLAVLLNRAVPIWLLDEPLSGLDSGAIDQVTALIQLHIGGGGIALIASHQPLAITGLTTIAIEDFAPAEELPA
jgi:heme exporter protein A